MIRRPPRSTPKPSSAASDVYKRQVLTTGRPLLGLTIGLELINGDVVWVYENVLPIMRPGDATPSAVLSLIHI
uniref:Uncharacterized protein n=1 Tax=Ralstonia solanacearum TaxID=305 RepID=A0A0S4W9T9_RALSL|nr:protein of unknown function [Ralstonia solanacearum]